MKESEIERIDVNNYFISTNYNIVEFDAYFLDEDETTIKINHIEVDLTNNINTGDGLILGIINPNYAPLQLKQDDYKSYFRARTTSDIIFGKDKTTENYTLRLRKLTEPNTNNIYIDNFVYTSKITEE